MSTKQNNIYNLIITVIIIIEFKLIIYKLNVCNTRRNILYIIYVLIIIYNCKFLIYIKINSDIACKTKRTMTLN